MLKPCTIPKTTSKCCATPRRPRTTDQHRQHHRRDLACVSRPLFGRCRIFSGANPRSPRCGRIEHLAALELLDQTAV
jgi:hypothetical protein